MVVQIISYLGQGAAITLLVTVLSFTISIFVSFLTGFALLSGNNILRGATATYVAVFRGTSAVVQVFFFFFVLPLFNLELPPIAAGVIALGLNFGAYGSEIVRSTVKGVDKGQSEAAIALGLSHLRTVFRIIIPQAIIAMIPLFGTELVQLVKATSLLAVVTIPEMTFRARTLVYRTGDPVAVYASLLAVYFVLAYPLSLLVKRLEAWAAGWTGRAQQAA